MSKESGPQKTENLYLGGNIKILDMGCFKGICFNGICCLVVSVLMNQFYHAVDCMDSAESSSTCFCYSDLSAVGMRGIKRVCSENASNLKKQIL